MIYDYLFFKGYQVGQMSRNYRDDPKWASIMFVGSCLIFNLGALMLLIEGSIKTEPSSSHIGRSLSYIVGTIVILSLWFYYRKRNQEIIKKYELLERQSGKKRNPVVIVISYLLVSIVLMFIAGAFKNGDWIFAK